MIALNSRCLASAALLATALTLPAATALAASVSVDMSGWQARGDFADIDNTVNIVSVPVGATVHSFSYTGLAFTTLGDSWLSELVLSINSSAAGTQFLDWGPSGTDAPGSFGPASGAWGDAVGVQGPYGSTGAFISSGSVWLTSYLAYSVPPVGIDIQQGMLHINYTQAVPEPASYALLGLALLAVGANTRRRSGG